VFIRTPVATATAIAVQAWRASLLRQAPGTFQFDSQHLPLVARSTSSASLLAWPHAMVEVPCAIPKTAADLVAGSQDATQRTKGGNHPRLVP